jgi:hypothetical protein
MTSCPLLLWSTYKTPAALSLNPNRRILTWMSSGCQNFPRPLRCRHYRRQVHIIAVVHPTFTESSRSTSAFTAAHGTAPSTRPSLALGPRCPTVTAVTGNYAVLPAVTAAASTCSSSANPPPLSFSLPL